MIEEKPDPDSLLKAIQDEEQKERLGKLKIFFGMSAGVGKTYAMLQEAHERLAEGVKVVIGTINTHGRQETEKWVIGLPVIAEKWVHFKNKAFQEMDLEKILEVHPQLVLVDELAHTNVPGSKHAKRWQDVLELLDAGIDVYTTLNVQHLETRKELVESITGITIFETVPDLVLERAAHIEIIDIPPKELLQRLKEGKVYLGEQSRIAAQHFFQEDHLTALREIALRFTAEKVEHDLHSLQIAGKGWKTRERLMVAISAAPSSQQLIRSARRLAFELDAPWFAVYIESGSQLQREDQTRLNRHLQLAKDLGAEVLIVNDLDIAHALESVARQKNITRLVIGRPSQTHFFHRLFYKNFLDHLVEESKQMDILILRQDQLTHLYAQTLFPFRVKSSSVSYLAILGFGSLMTAMGYFLLPFVGYKAVGYFFLMGILSLSFFVGIGPILLAAALSALSWDFLFIPPVFSFSVQDTSDIILLSLYFVTALVVGILSAKIRERDLFVYSRQEKIEHLYEIMQVIAQSATIQELKIAVCGKLKELFGGNFELLVKGGEGKLSLDHVPFFLKDEVEQAAARWSFQNKKIAGGSTHTLPSAKGIYFPVFAKEGSFAVLGYYPQKESPLSQDQLYFFESVAKQLAVYLSRFFSQEKIYNQLYIKQAEKWHNAIFRSLSKGFYAPLEKMFSVNQKLQAIAKNKEEMAIVEEINVAGKNLKMIVDNILTISELESGFIACEKKPHFIREIVQEAVEEVRAFAQKRIFNFEGIEASLSLPCDFKLTKIALKNLLMNAIEYSPDPSPIQIEVEVKETTLSIMVLDEGSGIVAEVMPFIFDKFYRAEGAPSEGIGLGLTIVKSIVDIHGGTLAVSKRALKGTQVAMIFSRFL